MRTYLRIAGVAAIAVAAAWPQLAAGGAYSYGSQPKQLQQDT